jgi:hypothetical protein
MVSVALVLACLVIVSIVKRQLFVDKYYRYNHEHDRLVSFLKTGFKVKKVAGIDTVYRIFYLPGNRRELLIEFFKDKRDYKLKVSRPKVKPVREHLHDTLELATVTRPAIDSILKRIPIDSMTIAQSDYVVGIIDTVLRYNIHGLNSASRWFGRAEDSVLVHVESRLENNRTVFEFNMAQRYADKRYNWLADTIRELAGKI